MGTKYRKNEIYKSFEECRKYVWKLDLTSKEEFLDYVSSGKLPEYIPSAPYQLFKDEWLSWPDWVGTKIGYKGTADFIVVDEFIKENKLNSVSYKKLYDDDKLPIDFPKKPEKTYKEFGGSWSVYLGKGKRKQTEWTDETAMNEAKKYKTKDELTKKSAGCHKYLKRKGLLEVATEHMKKKQPPITLEDALKLVNSKEFINEIKNERQMREKYSRHWSTLVKNGLRWDGKPKRKKKTI